MISNAQVFEEEHMPRSLQHREREIEQLSRALQPVVEGERAEDVLLSGPSGVGKTVLTRHMLDRLDEKAPVGTAHVRCVGSTAGAVLRDVIDALPLNASVHQGTPVDDLVGILRDGIGAPAVLVLDEADDIAKTDLFDRLALVPNASVVVICHEPEDWLSQLDERHRETFDGEHHLPLHRYTVGELGDILEARADRGLTHGVVDRGQLEEIADLVAGVARWGIQTLREAAVYAEDRGHRQIESTDITDGRERARKKIREANLRSLPLHHHVLYELVRREGPLTGTELHSFYDEMADVVYRDQPKMPVTRGRRRAFLRKLAGYDLIEKVPLDEDNSDGDVRYEALEPELCSEIDPLAEILPQ